MDTAKCYDPTRVLHCLHNITCTCRPPADQAERAGQEIQGAYEEVEQEEQGCQFGHSDEHAQNFSISVQICILDQYKQYFTFACSHSSAAVGCFEVIFIIAGMQTEVYCT